MGLDIKTGYVEKPTDSSRPGMGIPITLGRRPGQLSHSIRI